MNRPCLSRTYANGFTAIDLLICFVVLAILACIAYPTYTAHLRKAHRAEAKAILMETAQYMERYYATHSTYAGARVEAISAVSPKHADGAKARYRIGFAAAPTAMAFVLQAIPVNAQKEDQCGVLSINELGEQAPSSGTCW